MVGRSDLNPSSRLLAGRFGSRCARLVLRPVEIVERVRDVFHRHAKDTETIALTLPSFTACVLSLLGGQSKSDIPASLPTPV